MEPQRGSHVTVRRRPGTNKGKTSQKDLALPTSSRPTLLLWNCEKLTVRSIHHAVGPYVMADLANFYPTRTHLSDPGSTAERAPVVNDTMSTSTERLHRCGKPPPLL